MLSSYSGCRKLASSCSYTRPLVHHAARDLLSALVFGDSTRGTMSGAHTGGWAELFSGLRSEELPERLVFLNGAPGSGKTKALDTVRAFSGIETAYTMSTVISRHRKINADSLKSMTGLACDEAACSAVASTFRTTPMGTRDLILDGFPRSDAQVDFLEELIHHVQSLRAQNGSLHPQLDICMVVLNVDEATSIERQMARQFQAEEHNAAVRRTGRGKLIEERVTDKSESLCRDRYSVFVKSAPALRRVERLMPVYHIDASTPVDTCSNDIASALIEHRRKRSQSPLRRPAQTPSPLSFGSHACTTSSSGSSPTIVTPWWATWSTWLGAPMGGDRSSSSHNHTDSSSRSGWPPHGVVWS